MSTEAIDIVVSETGSRTVKRNFEDLGKSADAAGSAVESLQSELAKSASVQRQLEQEVTKLNKRITDLEAAAQKGLGGLGSASDKAEAAIESLQKELAKSIATQKQMETEIGNLSTKIKEMEKASRNGGDGHKKHEHALVGLKKEIVADNKVVNFFANSLNGIVPASSAAGEGIRLLAGAFLGGTALSMGIEVAMSGFTLLGHKMKENEERALRQIEFAGKQRASLIELSEAVEQYVSGLSVQGKGMSWFNQQLQNLSSEIKRVSNDAVTEFQKLQVLRDGWFNSDEIKEAKQRLKELTETQLSLQRSQYWVAKDYMSTVLPATLAAEEKAIHKSVADTVSAIDGETTKSKAFAWVKQNEDDIRQRLDALNERANELKKNLNPNDGTWVNGQWRMSQEQLNLSTQLRAFEVEIGGLESRLGRLKSLAAPIAGAQGRQVATEWEKQEAENARRVRREIQQLGANDYETINLRAAAAVQELTVRTNRTLEQMVDASETDKNRVRAAAAAESVAIEQKRMAEQTELMRKGGVLRELRSELDPVYAASLKVAAAEQFMDRAMAQGLVTAEQKSALMAELNYKYRDALDPQSALQREMKKEADLLALTTDEREVQSKLLNTERTLRQQGIQLTAEETDQIRRQYQSLQELNRVAQQRDNILKELRGPQQDLVNGQRALNQLLGSGAITLEEYNRKMSNMRLAAGQGSWSDGYLKSLGVLDKANQDFAARSGQAFGDMTNTLVNGFAEATARAIVFGENWEDAIGNVAREALAGLIAALIKVGIQMMLNYALGEALGAAAIASNVAMASSAAAAWAPAAALASLASFGANAGPAMAGITTTLSTTQGLALASLAGFQDGGYTGEYGVSQVAGVVHGKEFVVNADATKRNRRTLEAMNRGESAPTAMSIVVHNYSKSTVTAEQVSPSEVRIIARDEAQRAVREQAPSLVAAELENPNSRVSRSMSRNTNVQRKR